MRVIVVGASKIGCSLIKQMSKENVDIIVIDKNESVVDKITDSYDCNGYVGNGSSPSLLKKAGIDSTSLFVALTKSDETNILCCSVAKQMGVKRTIAAVRGPEYIIDNNFFLEKCGVDLFVNPDMIAAKEVDKLIKYAGNIEIAHFGIGNADIATVEIKENSVLANIEMPQIREILGSQVLVCAIERNGKIIIPKGNSQIKVGDNITLITIDSNMDTILEKLNVLSKKLKRIVIVGGGKIGQYLANIMMKQNIKVTLVDNNRNHCRELSEKMPNVNVICGDGTNYELMEAELKNTDACVTMTGRDEENLIISMFAKSLGMERIAAEIDNEKSSQMLVKSGINHTFSTQDVSIGAIIRDMRRLVAEEDDNDNNIIKWYYTLNSGKVEAVEFELTEEFKLLNVPFKDSKFKLKNGILVASIVRDGIAIIPNGESSLHVGDHIIVVSSEHKITKLTEILA